MTNRFFLLLVSCVVTLSPLKAQTENKTQFTLQPSVDFVSRYMWRGSPLSGAGLQPVITGEMHWGGKHTLGLQLVGFTDFQFTLKEFDYNIYYGYQLSEADKLSITLFDYWSVPEPTTGYFNYNKDSTLHKLELFADYAHAFDANSSLHLKWATFIYGKDKTMGPGGQPSGEQAFSSYFEIKYKGLAARHYNWEVLAGISPFKSAYTYYNNSFAVVNVGLHVERTFDLGADILLIPSVTATVNPLMEQAYLAFGLSFCL